MQRTFTLTTTLSGIGGVGCVDPPPHSVAGAIQRLSLGCPCKATLHVVCEDCVRRRSRLREPAPFQAFKAIGQGLAAIGCERRREPASRKIKPKSLNIPGQLSAAVRPCLPEAPLLLLSSPSRSKPPVWPEASPLCNGRSPDLVAHHVSDSESSSTDLVPTDQPVLSLVANDTGQPAANKLSRNHCPTIRSLET